MDQLVYNTNVGIIISWYLENVCVCIYTHNTLVTGNVIFIKMYLYIHRIGNAEYIYYCQSVIASLCLFCRLFANEVFDLHLVLHNCSLMPDLVNNKLNNFFFFFFWHEVKNDFIQINFMCFPLFLNSCCLDKFNVKLFYLPLSYIIFS